MKFLILLPFIISLSWAKSMSEPMTISQMGWSTEKKMYRLIMLKHSAIYWAPKKLETCLRMSLQTQKAVTLSFSPRDRIIKACN